MAPIDGLADTARSVLLLIDVQERLVAALPPDSRTRLLRNAKLLLRSAALLQVPVIASEQYPQGLGATLPELRELLPAGAAPFGKQCFAMCPAPGFEQALPADRDQYLLIGLEAHVCVLQTAFALMAQPRPAANHVPGHVMVVEDAIGARRPAQVDNALHRLRGAGVILTNTESVLFEWLRTADHPQFRQISAWIKEAAAAA